MTQKEFKRLNFEEIIIPPKKIDYPIKRPLEEELGKASKRAVRTLVLEQLRQAERTYNAAEQSYRVAEAAYQQARQRYEEAINRAWEVGAVISPDVLKMMQIRKERK